MGLSSFHGVSTMKINDIIKAMKTTCGAKTRSGGLCKNAPIGDTGRCRMHGGKSLSGIAHPNYKHGPYSNVWIARFVGEMYYRDD
jgi:hypothetical protein